MATQYVAPVSGTWAAKGSSPFKADRWSRTKSGQRVRRLHAGNDLQAADGTKAVAVIGGKVIYAGHNSGYQWNAVVLGDDGNAYRYATHGPLDVTYGQRVEQGKPVGAIARSHLHFEVIPEGSPALKAMLANPNTFVSTQWWPNKEPVTVDPAKFFGVERGAEVAAGKPVGNTALASAEPEVATDPFGVAEYQRGLTEKEREDTAAVHGMNVADLPRPTGDPLTPEVSPIEYNLARANAGQGVVQAAYAPNPSTDTAPFDAVLNGPGAIPSKDDIRRHIVQAATQRGIDPDIAVRVAQSEGLNDLTTAEDGYRSRVPGEHSYGPFQLYMGGGLGNAFQKETGLDPRDPATALAQVDFALDHAAANGWGAFHGAEDSGISQWAGLQGATPRNVVSGNQPREMLAGGNMPLPRARPPIENLTDAPRRGQTGDLRRAREDYSNFRGSPGPDLLNADTYRARPSFGESMNRPEDYISGAASQMTPERLSADNYRARLDTMPLPRANPRASEVGPEDMGVLPPPPMPSPRMNPRRAGPALPPPDGGPYYPEMWSGMRGPDMRGQPIELGPELAGVLPSGASDIEGRSVPTTSIPVSPNVMSLDEFLNPVESRRAGPYIPPPMTDAGPAFNREPTPSGFAPSAIADRMRSVMGEDKAGQQEAIERARQAASVRARAAMDKVMSGLGQVPVGTTLDDRTDIGGPAAPSPAMPSVPQDDAAPYYDRLTQRPPGPVVPRPAGGWQADVIAKALADKAETDRRAALHEERRNPYGRASGDLPTLLSSGDYTGIPDVFSASDMARGQTPTPPPDRFASQDGRPTDLTWEQAQGLKAAEDMRQFGLAVGGVFGSSAPPVDDATVAAGAAERLARIHDKPTSFADMQKRVQHLVPPSRPPGPPVMLTDGESSYPEWLGTVLPEENLVRDAFNWVDRSPVSPANAAIPNPRSGFPGGAFPGDSIYNDRVPQFPHDSDLPATNFAPPVEGSMSVVPRSINAADPIRLDRRGDQFEQRSDIGNFNPSPMPAIRPMVAAAGNWNTAPPSDLGLSFGTEQHTIPARGQGPAQPAMYPAGIPARQIALTAYPSLGQTGAPQGFAAGDRSMAQRTSGQPYWPDVSVTSIDLTPAGIPADDPIDLAPSNPANNVPTTVAAPTATVPTAPPPPSGGWYPGKMRNRVVGNVARNLGMDNLANRMDQRNQNRGILGGVLSQALGAIFNRGAAPAFGGGMSQAPFVPGGSGPGPFGGTMGGAFAGGGSSGSSGWNPSPRYADGTYTRFSGGTADPYNNIRSQ